jgi:hypothetical protein
MSTFKKYLETSSDTVELNEKKGATPELTILLQLAKSAESAWKAGNKEAYGNWMLAAWNSNETIKMGKFVTKAQAAEEKFNK